MCSVRGLILMSVLMGTSSCSPDAKDSKANSTSVETSPTTSTAPSSGGDGDRNVTVVGTLAVGFDDASIDTVRAFPAVQSGGNGSQVKNSISSPVVAGTLAIEIPQGGGTNLQEGAANGGDWAVALIDSTKAEKIDQIVGFLGIDSNGDSLMKLPINNINSAQLDFGSVSLSGSDAISSTKLEDEAKNFDLELEMLKEIASTDNLIQGLKNTYANTSADGSVFYSIQPFFIYKGNADQTINKFSAPTNIKYAPSGGDNADFGYGFYFKVKDPATATFDNICATDNDPKHKTLKFVPPSDLEKNSTTYNASNPLTNRGLTKTSGSGNVTCSFGEFYMSGTPGQQEYGFNFGGGGYAGAILPGIWKMYINDTQVAAYDLSAYSPVSSSGKPIVYIPALKLTVNPDNKIDKAEIKFYFWDKTTSEYKEVVDLNLFQSAVSKLAVTFNDNSGINAGCSGSQISEMAMLNSPTGNVFEYSSFKDGKWRAPGDLSTNEKTATGVTVSYDMAGVSISFDFRPTSDGCN
jgi:hypothetical protein